MIGTGVAMPVRAVAPQEVTRKVLTFDGSPVYGELSEPIVLSGDFEIEFACSIARVKPLANDRIMD